MAGTMTRDEAQQVLREYLAPHLAVPQARPDIADWAERDYYIGETGYPIVLRGHQKTWLRWADKCGCTTLVYSTVKKSGKTAINGVYSRYRAQYSGNRSEIYFIANDKEQAKDRAYESAKTSIELTPGYIDAKRTLPGQWRIVEKQARHLPTGSIMQALAGEYEGAAGGNPTLTSWTELWGFTSERFMRLWDELTPVPTRAISQRLVETYAGFVDESKLLWDLYTRAVKKGHRLSRDELAKWAGTEEDPWPYQDDPPFYINEAASTFTYWDDGEAAQRRMPWQKRSYYIEQASTERVESYDRLHLNYWVSSVQSFIKPAWWAACRGGLPAELAGAGGLPKGWVVVVAVDGSVSSDCTAMVGVCREPVWDAGGRRWVPSETDIRVVFANVWEPPRGGIINLQDVEYTVRAVCGSIGTIPEPVRGQYSMWAATGDGLSILECAYDQYQLHQMMTTLNGEFVVWCKAFSQAGERELADKQLYDLIVGRRIHHMDEFPAEFMENAAARQIAETAVNSDRIRIVKKAPDLKVDPVVCLSMAARECLRLLI